MRNELERIQSLIVIAGPSCVGKSTLLSQLQKGQRPQVADILGLDVPERWEYSDAVRMRLCSARPARLVLHYDLLRPFKLGIKGGYGHDDALDTLDAADQVTLLTLWALPRTLAGRAVRRLFAASVGAERDLGWCGVGRCRLNLLRSLARYATQGSRWLNQIYAGWFAYCEARPVCAHWLLDATGADSTPLAFRDWRECVRRSDA
jgi:hypothetical protein